MKTNRELLDEFFDCLRNLDTSVDRCVELFADDGVFELPYFPTIGINPRFEGKVSVNFFPKENIMNSLSRIALIVISLLVT